MSVGPTADATNLLRTSVAVGLTPNYVRQREEASRKS